MALRKKLFWRIFIILSITAICSFCLLRAETNRRQNEARTYFCEIIKEHMENDNDFGVAYGSPVSVEYYDRYEIDKTVDEFVRIPCLVKTELNTYIVWVDLGESETGYEVFYHSIVPMQEVE